MDNNQVIGGNFNICWKFKDLPYEFSNNYLKTGTEVYTDAKIKKENMYIKERQLNRISLMTDKEDRLERFNRELDIINFYSLAQKYGFCNPFCECSLCEKEQV